MRPSGLQEKTARNHNYWRILKRTSWPSPEGVASDQCVRRGLRVMGNTHRSKRRLEEFSA